MGKPWKYYFLGLQNHCRWLLHEIKRGLLLGRKAMTNLDSILKSRDISLPTNVHVVKAIFFPVAMYECESWTIKKVEYWTTTMVLEKTLENLLDCKEIKPVNPEWNQFWIFFGGTAAEATILWTPDMKSQLIRKDSDPGKDWKQEKRTIENKMVGWHHCLDRCEIEQAPGDGEGQGRLVVAHGVTEWDTTEQLNSDTTSLLSICYRRTSPLILKSIFVCK